MSGAVKVRGKDDGCCSVDFLKCVLYVFNFLFWLSGAALIGVGVWTLLMKSSFISLLASATFATTTYLLIATGAFIILVGFCGCCSAWREFRFGLMLYATLLLVIFLLEAVAGILAYIYQDHVTAELTRNLNTTMMENYMINREKTEAMDELHQHFKCCGSETFQDWPYSRWLKGNPDINNTAPDSCCKTVSNFCALRDHPSNIYYDGCVHSLAHFIREQLIILGAVGFGLCCLQLFGIVFACCLAKQIKEWKERQGRLAW